MKPLKTLLISITSLTSFYSSGQNEIGTYNFHPFLAGNEYSEENTRTIFQDSKGLIWMAFDSKGLCQYDGSSIDIYSHDSSDSTSISSNFINDIKEDARGTIWLATNKGLNIFTPTTNFFYKPNQVDNSVSMNTIFCQNDSIIWVGTDSGLLKFQVSSGSKWEVKQFFDPITQELRRKPITKILYDSLRGYWVSTRSGLYLFDKKNQLLDQWTASGSLYSLSDDEINDISQIDDYRLLIAADNGVNLFDISANKFSRLSFRDSKIFNDGKVGIVKTYIDSKNMVWIGTSTYGIVTGNLISDHQSQKISLNVPSQIGGIESQYIMDIIEDDMGQILVATKFGGIYVHDPRQMTFSHFLLGESRWDVGQSSQSFVVSVAQTPSNDLWIGTRERGLVKYDLKNQSFSQIPVYKGINELRRIESIHADEKGHIWLCHKHGLNKLDLSDLSSRYYEFDKIVTMAHDDSGDFWVGSYDGLYRFDPKEETFYRHRSKNAQFFENPDIRALRILCEMDGVCWFGTNGDGLFEYHSSKDSLVQHANDPLDTKSISSDKIRSISRSSSGQLWIGTKSSGLNKMTDDRNFQRITEIDGLASNSAFSLVEDENQNLWIGSNNGVSRLNTRSMKIDIFNEKHGLQDKVFERYAALRLSDGRIFLGGNNGFNIFCPNDIRLDSSRAPIMLSRIFSNSDLIASDLIKDASFIFSYDENNITFEFSALDYRDPGAILYKYQLDGIDEQWIESGGRNSVTYTNLDPGDYVFKFSATNSNGKWSDQIHQTSIQIRQPPWLTWWAKSLYFLATIGFCALIYWIALIRSNMLHDLKAAESELDRNKELNQLKIKFFTNISHEFRTPLALILAPLERLRQDLSIDQKVLRTINMAYKGAQQLTHLTDQLIYFRKADQDNLKLNVNYGDLSSFTKELINPFESLASNKGIDFKQSILIKNFSAWFDHDKLSKITNNLLFNAFKFTQRGGKIEISLETEFRTIGELQQKWAILSVSDTGEGIEESDLDRIFDRFYQSDDFHGGSGIGLELVKSLTELHKGEIHVFSKKGEGSTFSISIPIDKEAYFESELLESKAPWDQTVSAEILHRDMSDTFTTNSETKPSKTLLVVDDNEIMLDFMESTFSNQFILEKASNGKEALGLIRKTLPDIVISDVMMPGITGIELCNKIKSDPLTSHIPIVLLTAKVLGEEQVQGFESGADAYVTKPFDVQVLRARLHSIIDNREKLAKAVGEHSPFDPSKVSDNSLDVEFLTRIIEIIEDNYQNVNFSVEGFAQDLSMSRSQLFRKLKSLTGKTPSEYLYSYRISKSVQLLKNQEYNISEISYKTGFSSPNSFTKTFTKHMSMSPTRFLHSLDTSSPN